VFSVFYSNNRAIQRLSIDVIQRRLSWNQAVVIHADGAHSSATIETVFCYSTVQRARCQQIVSKTTRAVLNLVGGWVVSMC